MRKALLAVLVTAATGVVVVGSAGATGSSGHWICGPSGSVQIPSSIEGEVPIFVTPGMHVQKAAPAPMQSYYRVSYGNSSSCAVNPQIGTAYFIPATGEIRTVDSISNGHALWAKLSSELAGRLSALVQKVKPYAPPKKLRMVFVKDQTAAKPSSYLRLYTIGKPTRSAPNVKSWTGITLWGASTPWTDGKNVLSVSSRGSYLKRDGQLVRIPPSIAARIRLAKSIPT